MGYDRLGRLLPTPCRDHFLAYVGTETDDCLVWPFYKDDFGYGHLTYRGETLVHVLACIEHHGPRPEGKVASHSCRSPACFNHRHLSWQTKAEDVADRVRDGTDNRGSRHGLAKLDESMIPVIRRLYRAGISQVAIAADFGVDNTTISNVITRTTWRHVPDDGG